MISKLIRVVLIPTALLPCFLCVTLMSGCGDDGTPKPMALTEENKANIAAEQAVDEQTRGKKTTKGQP